MALAAALLLLLSAGIALAAPAGTVVGLSGECVVESGGTKSALALGQALDVGDRVDVPADGKLKLRMIDGSVISLAAGTQMTIATYAANGAGQRRDAQLSLTQGLLHAVVAPVEHPARFEVDTAVGAAAVRSTDWYVEASATTMRVGVLRGSVEMTSAATKHAATVRAGWRSRLEAGHDPAPPRVLRRSEFDALIARTRFTRSEYRHREPVRTHPAEPHRGRRGDFRERAAPRRAQHPARAERLGRRPAPEHPPGRQPEHPPGREPGGRQDKGR